ncbi:NMUR1.2 family protein [Megaselia abdita]
MSDMYDAFGDDCNQTLADMLTMDGITSGNNLSYEHKSIAEFLTIPEVRDNISEFFKNNSINISICNLTKLVLNYSREQQLTRNTVSNDEYDDDGNDNSDIILFSIITIFYAIIFIAGILGNLITCIVISRNKFMHTATNFYLFNLAVSDLILLLSGMPPDLYGIWNPSRYPFEDIMCFTGCVLSETAANATVLTITAFTVERYIAICHPFRQHTMSKLSRAIKFIFAIWLTAFILALPQAMQYSVIDVGEGKKDCSVNNHFYSDVFVISGFIFFVGPMTAICVLYVLIGVKLKRSRLLQAVQRRCYDLNRGISAQTRVIRMLVAVAIAFFFCWAPFHAQRLMAAYGSNTNRSELYDQIHTFLYYISGVLYFMSTCINPLLYNIMSHKFRDAFKITLTKQFGFRRSCQGGSGTGNHLYSALNRQNGSIRLNTTTMESLRTSSSIHHHHHNHHNHYGGSCRAHRLRCVSVSSQSTLMTSLSKNDVFAPTTYTSVMAATIPTGCSILLDDDLHKQSNLVAEQPPQPSTVDVEISENNDAKLTKKTIQIPEPVHEKLSVKKNNHDNNSSSASNRKSLKTLESLSEKLPWKARRKKPTPVFFRNNSNSSTSSTSSYTCNLNNNLHNLHNSKKSNIIIELSSTSSDKDVEDVEEEKGGGVLEMKEAGAISSIATASVEGETPPM